jgi:hypothetical protein
MRFQTRSFRPALTGGLLAAVLLWLPTVAQAATVTIAKSNVPGTPVEGGDTVSDFSAGVSQIPAPTPVLNDLGEVVFLATLTGNSASNIAILRGTGGPLVPLARKGGLTPDGTDTYNLLRQPAINNNGHIVFLGFELPSNLGVLYRLSSTNAQELARSGQLVPEVGEIGSFTSAMSFAPKPNSSGHVAFNTTIAGSFEMILRSDDFNLHTIAAYNGSNALGGAWRTLGMTTSLNDSNEFAFGGEANYPSLSLRTAHFAGRVGEPITNYYTFQGTTEPGGDGQYASGMYGYSAINQRGEFPITRDLTGTSLGTTNNIVLYRGSVTNPITQIVRRGDPAPDGIGRFNFTGIFTPKINEASQIAFTSGLAGPGVGTTNDSGIYVGSGGPLTQIVRENQLAPTTTNTLAGRFDTFPSDFAFNDAGMVSWATTTQLRGVNPGTSLGHGVFAGDGIDLINVARTGDRFDSTFMTGFSVGRDGLNRHGQIVYLASLDIRRTAVVQLWTPDLRWRYHTNGAWDAARRWTLSLTPAAVHHVFIQPTNAVTVTGPTNDVTVRSLNLGNATLQLQAGATLTATGGLFVATNTILSGNGGFVASFTNLGTISPGASAGALAVTGDVTFAASSVFVAELGGTAPTDFDRLHVQGNLSLNGTLQLSLINGHTLGDGQMYPIITVSGTRTGQFAGLDEGALVGNYGGRELFITYTNGIAVYTAGTALPNPTVVFQSGGAAVDLTFYGAPGQQYLLQRTETLNPAGWITLQTIAAAPDGKISYTDANPPVGGAFYRITPP